MAHRNGIRISTVNPKGTSMYAYDGSGEVTRDENLVFHILDGGLSENSKRSIIQIAQSYKNAKIE